MEAIIRTDKLTKSFGDVKAVSDLSLHVNKGEIYGFLGLNGAGKTTTIRMLLGMISAGRGKAYIKGQRVYPGNTRLWQDVGYLVEIPYSYPNLTVRENLEITRRLRLVKDTGAVERIMDKLALTRYADRKAGNLSLGNAQRLGIAKAMIHNPGILILDEPANGLDPAGIYEIRGMLLDLARNHGVTVFISSHILGEISRFASRIGIIHEGELIRELDTHQLESLCQKRLLVSTRKNGIAREILQKNGILINKSSSNGVLEILENNAIDHPDQVARLLVNNDLPPVLLHVDEEDLESYFLRTIKMKGAQK